MGNTFITNKILELVSERDECKSCPMYGKEIVVASGKRNCDFLFVGLNPGKEEIVQDTPFVGSAGKLLRELIDYTRMKNVAFTNCILCHTKNEADIPSVPKVIKHCRPLVRRIIQWYNPLAIIPLGNTCSQLYFGIPETMNYAHGHWYESNVFPLYHPSALLYGKMNKIKYAEALLRIKRYVRRYYEGNRP